MDNNIPEGCLPFDFEKVKQGARVRTRDGREANYFGESSPISAKAGYPHVFVVDEHGYTYQEDGRFDECAKSYADLFLVDENYAEPEYKPTMIISPPDETTNREFQFKQEIAAQFVLGLLNSPEYKSSNPTRAIIGGLDNYQIFIEKCKERFQK